MWGKGKKKKKEKKKTMSSWKRSDEAILSAWLNTYVLDPKTKCRKNHLWNYKYMYQNIADTYVVVFLPKNIRQENTDTIAFFRTFLFVIWFMNKMSRNIGGGFKQ